MTTPRDSYAWNNEELAILLTLSESLAEVGGGGGGGLEPPTIGSMSKNLCTKSNSDTLGENLAESRFESLILGKWTKILQLRDVLMKKMKKVQNGRKKSKKFGTKFREKISLLQKKIISHCKYEKYFAFS